MSDLELPPSERSVLDSWLLEARAPDAAPDLSVSVMAAVRQEARHAAPSRPAFPDLVPPPLFSGSAIWRPALAMVGAFALAVLAWVLLSDTAGGEQWLSMLLAAVENPLFKWLAGTLLACGAAIAVPMAWMEA